MAKFKIKKKVITKGITVYARLIDPELSQLKALAIKNKQNMGSIVRQMVEHCLRETRRINMR